MALSEERGTTALAGILIHYFQMAWREAGLSWDGENAGEIQDAVEQFADTVESAIADAVERRIAELRELEQRIADLKQGRS